MLRRTRLVIAALLILASSASAQVAETPPPLPPDRPSSVPSASLKVDVTPRQTQVFIDGYYVGIADDFDGAFQQLRLEAGNHTVQLFLPDYRLHTEHVSLQANETIRVRHTMERLSAGEQQPRRPAAVPRPPRTFAPMPGQGPPRSEREYGSLSIRVQPSDAELLIDGTAWSTTADAPLVVQLAPGRHTIEVRRSGYRTYLTEITVQAGETAPLNISLSRNP